MSLQTKYDKTVEQCCIAALASATKSTHFVASIIDDIYYRLPDLELSRNQISYHINVALGCVHNDVHFIAKKWSVKDKDRTDVSDLLNMLRMDY